MSHFPFTALTLLVGRREGHPDCKKKTGWWLDRWWRFDWSFARLIALVVTTTSIILCFNKHRLTQVHLAKRTLKWRERETLISTGASKSPAMVHRSNLLPVRFTVAQVQTVHRTQPRRAVVATDHVHSVLYRRRRHVPSLHRNSLQLPQTHDTNYRHRQFYFYYDSLCKVRNAGPVQPSVTRRLCWNGLMSQSRKSIIQIFLLSNTAI